MIIDKLLEFADGFDLTEIAGTYLLTNQIDMDNVRDVGAGRQAYLVIQIDTAISGTSSTINFRLRSDSTAAIHATTSTAHVETGAIAEAVLVAGHQISIALPAEGNTYEQFLGVQAIIGTATITVGTCSCFITFDPPSKWKAYADATN